MTTTTDYLDDVHAIRAAVERALLLDAPLTLDLNGARHAPHGNAGLGLTLRGHEDRKVDHPRPAARRNSSKRRGALPVMPRMVGVHPRARARGLRTI